MYLHGDNLFLMSIDNYFMHNLQHSINELKLVSGDLISSYYNIVNYFILTPVHTNKPAVPHRFLGEYIDL